MVDFWGLAGPRGPGDPFKRWGSAPPTFWKGLPGTRGRPDPKNLPCPERISDVLKNFPVAEIRRDPEVGFWPSVFAGGLGTQGHQTTHFIKQLGFWALLPKVPSPTNHNFPEIVRFFDLVPQASKKNTWPQNKFGLPLIWF